MDEHEELLEEVVSFRITATKKASFLDTLKARGWTKDSVLRELVDSFVELGETNSALQRPLAVVEKKTAAERIAAATPDLQSFVQGEVMRQLPDALRHLFNSRSPVEDVVPRQSAKDSTRQRAGRKESKTVSADRRKVGKT